MMVSKDILRKIPKVDLHCHLDGSVRPQTILELAKKKNFKFPDNVLSAGDLKKYVSVSSECHTLTEFLKVFDFYLPFLNTPEAVERISYELCEDCAKENVRYLEVRFAPFLQSTETFNMKDVVSTCLSGLKQGSKDFGIDTGLILCCLRSFTDEINLATVELASLFKDNGVVALDLAGDESRYPTRDFSGHFSMAKKYKIPFTIHAGEASGPESIREAISIGASRIGHGTNLIKDEKLLNELKVKQVPIEVCITSNIQTNVVKDAESHPVTEFYKRGLNVTLNTDDRSVSGIELSDEFDIFVNRLRFLPEDLYTVVINAAGALFLPDVDRKNLISSIKKEFAELKISGDKK
ncbi:MAG: Aminodeoxyfutalosine deaminase [Elusimicrobia bacterium ADurb.Bin231]|nr:MAG: Aminodeoxyfutalosine deaminase [Elusimicrobia bacterium ADurb.Bin231]